MPVSYTHLGLEAASTPSTASRFGAEKISSVGMFATKRTPLFAVSAPAIQTCSSGSPTTCLLYTSVDFMVGTEDLSIIGTTKDGREVTVFENGRFAL